MTGWCPPPSRETEASRPYVSPRSRALTTSNLKVGDRITVCFCDTGGGCVWAYPAEIKRVKGVLRLVSPNGEQGARDDRLGTSDYDWIEPLWTSYRNAWARRP